MCEHAGAVEAQVCGEEQLVAIMHQGLAARTVAGKRSGALVSSARVNQLTTVAATIMH